MLLFIMSPGQGLLEPFSHPEIMTRSVIREAVLRVFGTGIGSESTGTKALDFFFFFVIFLVDWDGT